MGKVTLVFGGLLVALGVGGWALTGMQSPTALIPAAFGVVLEVLGALALQERFRKHAMHAAALVGLLGFLGSASALGQLPALAAGTAERPAAAASRAAMAVLTALFIGLCVRSFVAARRARAI